MKRKVSELRVNRFQMRQELDPDAMMALALRFMEVGQQPDRPIIITEDGEVVKGHRAWMALMIVELAKKELGKNDQVRVMAAMKKLAGDKRSALVCPDCKAELRNGTCPECGAYKKGAAEKAEIEYVSPAKLAAAYNAAVSMNPNFEVLVEIKTYEGDDQMIVDLVSDNTGMEQPDMLGQARVIREMIRRGEKKARISRLMDIDEKELDVIMAAASCPPRLVRLVTEHQATLSILRDVSRLPEEKQEAVTSALEGQAENHLKVTLSATSEYIKRIQDFLPEQGMVERSPKNEYDARIRNYLWDKLDHNTEFWTAVATDKIQMLKAKAGVLSTEDITENIPELSCDNCQLRGILEKLPSIHVYPCQVRETETCPYACPQKQPFRLLATSDADREKAVRINGMLWFTSEKDATEGYAQAKQVEQKREGVHEVKQLAEENKELADFMKHSEQASGVDHPFTTHCQDCQYHAEGKCLWENKKTMVFHKIEAGEVVIPVCGQFMPIGTLESIPNEDYGWIIGPAALSRRLVDLALVQLGDAAFRRWVGLLMDMKIKGRTQIALNEYWDNLSDRQRAVMAEWALLQMELAEKKTYSYVTLKFGDVEKCTLKTWNQK